jgi:hypothetical protein
VSEFRAAGVVQGLFLAERGVLVTTDGRSYPASALPGLKRWAERHPKEAAAAEFHIVYPRTVKGGIAFEVAESLSDLALVQDLKQRPQLFVISGVLTNQRSRQSQLVIRVSRNRRAPAKRHRENQFRPHLIWLSGRAAPAANFNGKHIEATAALDGDRLVLRRIEAVSERKEEPFTAGGITWPWPFEVSLDSIERLCKANLPAGERHVAPVMVEEVLGRGITRLRKLLDATKRIEKPSAQQALEADRLRLIHKRLKTYLSRLNEGQLELLTESTGLHRVLLAIEVQSSGKAKSQATGKAKSQAESPEPQQVTVAPQVMPQAVHELTVPQDLVELDTMLRAGFPDGLISMTSDYTPAAVRAGVDRLIDAGWLDTLTEAERKKIASYRVKRVMLQRRRDSDQDS